MITVICRSAALSEADVSLAVKPCDKHVKVVKAPGSGIAELVLFLCHYALYRLECVGYVTGGSVHMRTDGARPFMNVLISPVAGGEKYFLAGCAESKSHSVV